MRDKLISGFIGAIIGGVIVFGYGSIFSSNKGPGFMGERPMGGSGQTMGERPTGARTMSGQTQTGE